MGKGKFLRPRSPRQEERELEQAFEQVTRAANGESRAVTPDTISDETVVVPTQKIRTAAASAQKRNPPASAPVPRPDPANQNRKTVLISLIAAASVLVICLIVGAVFHFSSHADSGLIMNNTYVAGINMGGLTPEEARTVIHNATDSSLLSQSLVVQFPDATLELSPEDTNVKLDVDLLVETLYQFGREENGGADPDIMATVSLTGRKLNLLSFMTLDTGFIRRTLDEFSQQNCSDLKEPTVKVEGTRPAEFIFDNLTEESISSLTETVHQTITVTMGSPRQTFDADLLYEQILDAYNHNDLSPIDVTYEIQEPESPDLNVLIKEHCVDPVNAEINEEDYTVQPEIWGYGFDQKQAKAALSAAKDGEVIHLPLRYIKPEIIKTELESTLFCDELASKDSPYYLNPPRTTNLLLACQAIDGYIVKPGETFSFNKTLGERTAEKGYQSAGAYVDGETVDQLGGGICQVASTLYYCTLFADLETVERYEHMYSADYVPLGMDATINWGTLDFCFRNDTKYPIRIEANAEDGYVTVTLFGTDKKDYYVDMEYEVVKELEFKTVEKELDENNKDGYKDGDVIRSGYTGYIVDTYKCKYDKQTDELISRTYESHSEYETRDKQICKIKKPTEPSTEPPTQAPTEAPTEQQPSETEAATEAPTKEALAETTAPTTAPED